MVGHPPIILHTSLLVGILLGVSSGHFLVEDFPVNLTCISHEMLAMTFRCTWLPPQNDSMDNCRLYFKATDENEESISQWPGPSSCKSLAEWNECDQVLRDEPVCKIPLNPCPFEDISLMLRCENHIMSYTSPDFSTNQIVIPNPPSGLRLIATAKGRMSLSWKLPSGWSIHDLHALQFIVKYWQEVEGKQLNVKTIHIVEDASEILPRDLSGLEYSYVNTCVQMSSIFEFNVYPHQSDWSAVVCNRTLMESPTGKPENLTATDIFLDVKIGTRKVNLSWTPIPEIQQGGPIKYYEVTIGLSESVAVHNISECFIVFNQLNATYDYDIKVAAWNDVGRSIYATYFLRRLEDPIKVSSTSRYVMLTGVILFMTFTLLVIFSGFMVLKRKLRKGNDVELKINVIIPDKPDVSHGNIFTREKEVFDIPLKKKESNNNKRNVESTDDTDEKSFQQEEYQPFIVEKNGLTTNAQSNYVQAASTGYVDAEGKGISDGKMVVDLKSEGIGNVVGDLKYGGICNGNMIVDLKSEGVYVSHMVAELKCEGVCDGNPIIDLKSEGVSDGKMVVDLKSEGVYVSHMVAELKCEGVCDGNPIIDLKSEGVSDGKMVVDLKSEGVYVGNIIVDLKSEGVSDGKMVVDLESVDGNCSCKYLADFEKPYIPV